MDSILSYGLFGCVVMSFYFGLRTIQKQGLKNKENKLFALFCFATAVRILGFCLVLIQREPEAAYRCRALGLAGMLGYVIMGTMLLGHLANIPKNYRMISEGFTFLGLILYPIVIRKEQVTYEMADFGMAYQFNATLGNRLYTTYCAVAAINMLVMVIYLLIRSNKKRYRIMGKKMLIAELIIVAGMILDTILPMFGFPAFPGSTIGQFLGLIVIYDAFSTLNRTKISYENISEFVYYSMSVPILVYDVEEQLKIINKYAEDFFGMGSNRIGDKPLKQLFKVEDDVFRFSGEICSVDATCRANEVFCNLAINKIYDAYQDIIGYIIVVSDLTERMKTVKELEKAIKEADRANEAKSTFLANMSHEIRTPMHAIIGFSELVMKSDISDEIRQHVKDIQLASNNLLAIINDILDISKIESGKMEIVPTSYYTSTLMKDVSMIIASQAERKGLKFEMNVDPTLPSWLYGDKVRIRGVLINILNNAVKYTREGSITFNVKVTLRTDTKVRILFEVIDTGVGIKEEDQKNIFKSFEQLDRQVHYGVEGSGLGLAIANGYVKLMGGFIKLDSKYGEGSKFSVTIEQKIMDEKPIDKVYVHQEGSFKGEEIEEFTVKDTSVLVVDDNKVNLRVAQGLMKSYGLQVDVADGGKQAIEMCVKKNYPIVFMDQMMPEVDGIVAMKEIRKQNSYYEAGGEGKIIVLTADAIGGVKERLTKEGFDDYLGKPINVKQLERVLMQIIPEDKIIRKEHVEKEEEVPTDKELEIRKTIDELKEKLPDMDVELGMGRCGNAESEYLQILKIAYDYGEARMKQLEDFQSKKAYDDYGIKVHSLKSTALNIGAVEVSKLAEAQENACKEGNYSYIDENMEKLLDSYQNVINHIGNLLVEKGILQKVEDTKEESMDEKMALQILASIRQYVDEFSFDKVFDILEQLETCKVEEPYNEIFDKIREYMDDLEIDQVKKVIDGAYSDKE